MSSVWLLTITREDEELLLAVDGVGGYLGIRSDYLLLGLQCKVLLELKVSDGTRQCKVAVDAAKLDKATRRGDTSSLFLVCRLVVLGEGLGFALVAEDGAGVACVCLKSEKAPHQTGYLDSPRGCDRR